MVKSRMTVVDVRAMVHQVRQSVLGYRMANVYDVNNKTYLLKMSSPGTDKVILVIESGVRFHTTRFERSKSQMPSGFSMKLRKHLRTRRLTDVRQLGLDRVLDLTFGANETAHHIIVEYYASGNIILTDSEYTILALLRPYTLDDSVRVAVRETYPLPESTHGMDRDGLASALAASPAGDASRLWHWCTEQLRRLQGHDAAHEGATAADTGEQGIRKRPPGRGKRRMRLTLRNLLARRGSGVGAHGPAMIEHCVLAAGLAPSLQMRGAEVPEEGVDVDAGPQALGPLTPDAFRRLVDAFAHLPALVASLTEGERPAEGFIVLDARSAEPDLTLLPGASVVEVTSPEPTLHADPAAVVAQARAPEAGPDDPRAAAAAAEASAANSKAAHGHAEARAQLERTRPVMYDGFSPLLLNQLRVHSRPRGDTGSSGSASSPPVRAIRFDTFAAAVDEYFTRIEEQALLREQASREDAVLGKLDRIRRDHQDRIRELEESEEQLGRKAMLIEANLVRVQQALTVLNSALANGIDWDQLAAMVVAQKRAGNPVALIIHQLDLDSNCVDLVLEDPDAMAEEGEEEEEEEEEEGSAAVHPEGGGEESGESEEDDEDAEDASAWDLTPEEQRLRRLLRQDKAMVVGVDISLSPHANARRLYDKRRDAAAKREKTEAAGDVALKHAEKRTQEQLKVQRVKTGVKAIRHPYWFERYHWCISSENYLIVAGKNAQQNEQLVKRYLRHEDVYVHAEIHGAPTCIVRNAHPGKEVPSHTLQEAGTLTMCWSTAWEARVVTSAWWVYAHQVSKTAPSGEYLSAGSFMIRGKKNFLGPERLELGFGLMFRVDDDSLARHIGERRPRGELEESYLPDTGNAPQTGRKASAAADTAADTVADEDFVPDAAQRDEGEEQQLEQGEGGEEDEDEGDEDGGAERPNEAEEGDGDEDDDDEEEEDDKQSQAAQSPSVSSGPDAGRRLTARERRLLKQARKRGDDRSLDELTAESEAAKEAKRAKEEHRRQQREERERREEEEERERLAQGLPAVKSGARGKRGKLKKIREKYADQDEEERRLRMAALGHKVETAPCKEAVGSAGGEGGEGEGGGGEGAEGTDAGGAPEGGGSTATAAGEAGQAVGGEGGEDREAIRRQRRERRQGRAREESEVRQIMREENLTLTPDEKRAADLSLDALTARPTEEDTLLFALPVCGPYRMMAQYKFKVKLVPGTLKKGKAAKQAVDLMGKMNPTPRERDLIRSLDMNELVQSIAGGVKVSTPGAAQGGKKGKGGGKGGKGGKKGKKK